MRRTEERIGSIVCASNYITDSMHPYIIEECAFVSLSKGAAKKNILCSSFKIIDPHI